MISLWLLEGPRGMPRVYSKRNGAEQPPTGAVYVGRPTQFGNPFVVGKDGSHREVVELYREWIMRPECTVLRARAKRDLAGRDLVCWCAPNPCHADVLLEVANGTD